LVPGAASNPLVLRGIADLTKVPPESTTSSTAWADDQSDLVSRLRKAARENGVQLSGVGTLSITLPSGTTFRAQVNRPGAFDVPAELPDMESG
jgi:hypothetical protein